jgi:HSP20 family protein
MEEHILMIRFHQWNPMRDFAEAERRFAALFEQTLRPEPQAQNGHATWTPAVDVSENSEAFLFTVELPGMKPEAVEIEVKDNILTIKGERASVEAKDGVRIHHRERPTGRFARAFRLQKPVEAEKVTATYRDGLLEVVVPLRAEAKPRKIPVAGN